MSHPLVIRENSATLFHERLWFTQINGLNGIIAYFLVISPPFDLPIFIQCFLDLQVDATSVVNLKVGLLHAS